MMMMMMMIKAAGIHNKYCKTFHIKKQNAFFFFGTDFNLNTKAMLNYLALGGALLVCTGCIYTHYDVI